MRRICVRLPGFRLAAAGSILSIRILGLTVERVGRIVAVGGWSFVLPGGPAPQKPEPMTAEAVRRIAAEAVQAALPRLRAEIAAAAHRPLTISFRADTEALRAYVRSAEPLGPRA